MEKREYIEQSLKDLYNGDSMDLNFLAALYGILSGLKVRRERMSKKTNDMQKQLLKALTVQTVIPICVSFSPCIASFYGAAFLIPFPNFVYWISPVAVAMFPFLDPLAVIIFLPSLRRRFSCNVRISAGLSLSNPISFMAGKTTRSRSPRSTTNPVT
uniref:Uncharacterized protein n=1 Tax=Caenorhabditis japonica TaxID=281687 RepID=A0A8R1HSS7_CAEJA